MKFRTALRKLFKSYFEMPTVRILAKLGLSPNWISLIGLIVAGVSAYLLSEGLFWMGGLVLLVSGLFDLLDGALARYTGRDSPFGALFDSTLDRFAEAIIMLGVLVYYQNIGSSIGVILCYIALVGSVMVSYLRARSEGLGVECKVGILTRPERISALCLAFILAHWWEDAIFITLVTICVLTFVTSCQRLVHVYTVLGENE